MLNSVTFVAGVFSGNLLQEASLAMQFWNEMIVNLIVIKRSKRFHEWFEFAMKGLRHGCNDGTSGSSFVCLLNSPNLWHRYATYSFRACINKLHRSMCVARTWKQPVNNVERYQMIVARLVSSDIWCCGLVMLFCQNLEWHWNLLPRHCNEHCLSAMWSLFSYAPSHLQCALYFMISWVDMCAPKNCATGKQSLKTAWRDFPDPTFKLSQQSQVLPICPWLLKGFPVLCQLLNYKPIQTLSRMKVFALIELSQEAVPSKSLSLVGPLPNWKSLSIWIKLSSYWPSLVSRPIRLQKVLKLLLAKPSTKSYQSVETIEVVCRVKHQSQSIWRDKSYLLCKA